MCKHDKTEVRKKLNSIGTKVCVRQCLTCYGNLGMVKTKDYEWELLNWFDGEAREEYDKQQREEWRAKNVPVYHEYLTTDEWRALRNRVMERDNHLCQGCLSNRATEVHHKTYKHCRNELAFELVALCRDCHARIHGKPVTNTLESILY